MTSKEELIGLGELILKAEFDVLYIKDLHISEQVNEHGTMTVRFLVKGEVEQPDALRQQGAEVKLTTKENEDIFYGKCTDVRLNKANEYTEVELTAATLSIATDAEKHTCTFQKETKSLKTVMQQSIGKNADINFESGLGSLVIKEMLSQNDETDWEFGRRIANQYQKLLFVNSKASKCQIHIGNYPFQIKKIGNVLYESVYRDVDKVRLLQGNHIPNASVFEYESTVLTVSDLTIGVGYAGCWNRRKQTVIKSVITCKQGLLQNEITLTNEDGLSPTVEQTLGVKKRSSILKGTVLEVEGNNVKIDFGTEGDEPRWIPYANTSSNYFYSMPDVGDTVVVYYETGDSDRIVCIGSRHVNESPDFKRYQDKMLTADNRMLKFGDKSIEIVGNRAKHDGYKGEQAKIIFNDEFGMQIQSTNEIRLKTTNSGNIVIQSVSKGFRGMNATKQKFELMYGIGNTMFVATGGGIPDAGAISPAKAVTFEKMEQGIGENIDSPLQVVEVLQELAGSVGGTAGTGNAETSEGYQDGVVNIYAVDSLVLKVGSSSITFANGVIQIKAGKFRQLGSDRVKGGGKGSGFTWQDMVLDVGAVGSDVSGALPVPKASTAENLSNAGVSLSETEYIGGALSAATEAVSLSRGGKSDSPSVPKPVSATANKVEVFQGGAEGSNVKLPDGMRADNTEAATDASYNYIAQENQQDVSETLTVKRKKRKTRYKGKNKKQNKKQNKKTQNKGKSNKSKNPNTETSKRKTEGDPIDIVTGSYLIEQCDFIINDICGIYAVERTYESLLSDEDSPIGRGWTLSLFSTAYIYDDRIEIVLPDNHTETFLKTEEGYRNR